MKSSVKMFLPVLLAGIIISGCKMDNNVNQSNSSKEKAKQNILKTDNEFYTASQKIGTGRAFIEFADNDVLLLREGSLPLSGKSDLVKLYADRDTVISSLKWKPLKAGISDDGTLGYTFGNWQYTVKAKEGRDNTTYGVYVTIWKKQKNGTWKYVLDGGNTTPTLFE